MSRALYRHATLISAAAFAVGIIATAAEEPHPRLLWNSSASAPVGLYRVHVGNRPQRGAFAAILPPPALAGFMVRRRYLGKDAPMLKRVVAMAGDRVCRTGIVISINGDARAIARMRDHAGRVLPSWSGCRTLEQGELFLLNTPPDSFDSRYFGPLSDQMAIGAAMPIITRARQGSSWCWRCDPTARFAREAIHAYR